MTTIKSPWQQLIYSSKILSNLSFKNKPKQLVKAFFKDLWFLFKKLVFCFSIQMVAFFLFQKTRISLYFLLFSLLSFYLFLSLFFHSSLSLFFSLFLFPCQCFKLLGLFIDLCFFLGNGHHQKLQRAKKYFPFHFLIPKSLFEISFRKFLSWSMAQAQKHLA